MLPFKKDDAKFFDKHAVLYSNGTGSSLSKSYAEIYQYIRIVTTNISGYITEQYACIGLLMDLSIYTPAVIWSIREMEHAFTFLTEDKLEKSVEDLNINWLITCNVRDIKSFKEIKKFYLDTECLFVLWRRIDVKKLMLINNYKSIFCVVQTSGSTGTSKLVKVPYKCISENAEDLRNLFDIGIDDLVYWGTPLTFDPTWIEFLIAWRSNACLLIVPLKIKLNPAELYKTLFCENNVTFLQMVPSVFTRWNDGYIRKILMNDNLRVLAFGGEPFPKLVLRHERNEKLRLFNLYGTTEVSCWATVHEITDESEGSDTALGKAIGNTILEIRDASGRNLRKGKGEIFIGSSSRVCFVGNETVDTECIKEEVIFRETGDLGIKTKDDTIIYGGRKDRVIKRFGQKINMSNIEEDIFKQTGLINKCIWSQTYEKLMTFILISNLKKDGYYEQLTLDKIRNKIVSSLPSESLPDYFKIVDHFPLGCHGKVSERNLELLYQKSSYKLTQVVAFTNIFCKVLGLDKNDIEDIENCNFFRLGGTSIKAIQLIREFEADTGISAPDDLLKHIFENQLKDCLCCLTSNQKTPISHNTPVVSSIINKRRKIDKEILSVSWTYDTKACVDGTPLVFEKSGEVFIAIGSFSHNFVILNQSGLEVYKVVLPDIIESRPLLSANKQFIYIGCYNGFMYCLDIERKSIQWEYQTGDRIRSSPSLCKNESCLVFGSYDHKVYCLNEFGSPSWISHLDGSVPSSPLPDDEGNRIFATTTRGTCYCLSNENGHVIWSYNCGKPIYATPCLVNNKKQVVIGCVNGTVSSLDSSTGQIVWTYVSNNLIFSSLVAFESYVIFGCHDKCIHILRGDNLELVHKLQMDSAISSTSFIYEKSATATRVISACNTGTISVFDLDTFNLISSVCLPNEVFSSPIVHCDNIYVGCRDNNLYCLNISNK